MLSIEETYTWAGKYRPKTIGECILPKKVKDTFNGMVKNNNLTHLILSGRSGTGKSTIARALCEQLDCEVMFINASLEGRKIETIRNDIQQFASSFSFEGKRKVVIMDEFDGTTDMVQMSLKSFLETFESNCTFIFTANFPNRIIDAIKSRCSHIEFVIPKEESNDLIKQMFIRTMEILNDNQIQYDKAVIGKIVKKYFPDYRKTLTEIQKLAAVGNIDVGCLSVIDGGDIIELMNILKSRKFPDMRAWVASCPNLDMTTISRKMYDKADEFIVDKTIPELVLIIAEYSYKDCFVSDKEINMVAFLTQVMKQCQFK